MLCIKCGQKEAVINALCIDCFFDDVDIGDLSKRFEISKCTQCNALKLGDWVYNDIKNNLSQFFKKHINVDMPLDYNTNFDFVEEEEYLKVHVRLILKKDITKDFDFTFKFNKEICPRCNRYFGNYFEAVLQIRGKKEIMKKKINEIREEIYSLINMESSKNPNIFLTKEEEEHGGLDFYMSNKNFTRNMAKKIGDKYNATLKESSTIVGRKDGNDLYRSTYSLKIPDYGVGDVIRINKELFFVKNMTSSTMKVIILSNGIEKTLSKKYLLDNKVYLVLKDAVKEAVVISSRGKDIQILDPDTYKTMDLILPNPYENTPQTVKIIKLDSEIFIVY